MNKQIKKRVGEVVKGAAYGGVGSLTAIALNKLIGNKATHVVNLIGGIAMQTLSNNEVVRGVGAGFTSVGAVGTASLIVPSVSNIQGLNGCYAGVSGCGCGSKLGCAECGGTCGQAKKCGCNGGNSPCGCNKGLAGGGLGNVFDPKNRNTGSFNGGVLKTNVTKADLLTLPGATQALVDLVPNADRTLYGFQFQAFTLQPDFTHKSPRVNHWELIYNFYPQLFERLASEIPNPSAVKSVIMMQNPQRTWSGALSRMPKMCAFVKVEMKDGTQRQFPYAVYGSPFTAQASICAWGTTDTGTCGQGRTPNTFTGSTKETGAIQTQRGWEAEVGQALTFTLKYYEPNKFYYWAEVSDGSGFFIDSQTFSYTFEDTGNMMLNIFAWEKNFPTSAGGKICVADGTFTFIINPRTQPAVQPTQPAVQPSTQALQPYIIGEQNVGLMDMQEYCILNPNEGLGLAESDVTWTWSDGMEQTTPNTDPKKLCTKRLFNTPGTYSVQACFYTEIPQPDGGNYKCLVYSVNVSGEMVTTTTPPLTTVKPNIITIPEPPKVSDPTPDGCIYPDYGAKRICCDVLPPDTPNDVKTIVTPPPGNVQEVVLTTTTPPPTTPPTSITNEPPIYNPPIYEPPRGTPTRNVWGGGCSYA